MIPFKSRFTFSSSFVFKTCENPRRALALGLWCELEIYMHIVFCHAHPGVERIDDVSNCLKQGIYKGHIPFKGEEKPLDTVVISRKCDYCRDLVTLCVRDLLYQDDYGGIGYDGKCPPSTHTRIQWLRKASVR